MPLCAVGICRFTMWSEQLQQKKKLWRGTLNECLILIGFSLSAASSLLPAISDSINTVVSESFLEYKFMTEYCFRGLALTKRQTIEGKQTIEVHCFVQKIKALSGHTLLHLAELCAI